MLKQLKINYFKFLEQYQYISYLINTYTYLYIILWILQILILICILCNIIFGIKIFLIILISLVTIHFCTSLGEILNDYIFNNFLKKVLGLITLLISCKIII